MTAIATRILEVPARLLWAAGVQAAVAGAATLSRADAPTPVLIVTSADYVGRRWQETAPLLKAAIERREEIKADALDDLTKLAAADLSSYAAVVLHFKNWLFRFWVRLSSDKT